MKIGLIATDLWRRTCRSSWGRRSSTDALSVREFMPLMIGNARRNTHSINDDTHHAFCMRKIIDARDGKLGRQSEFCGRGRVALHLYPTPGNLGEY